VKQLRAGLNEKAVRSMVHRGSSLGSSIKGSDDGNIVTAIFYCWKNATYCIYSVSPGERYDPVEHPIISVKVLRLPPIARTYAPYTKLAPRFSTPPAKEGLSERYMLDVLKMIAEDKMDEYGVDFKSIHVDPPFQP
jgi:hypothetical protein